MDCHQIAIVRGGHPERFGGCVPAKQLDELRSLPVGNARIVSGVLEMLEAFYSSDFDGTIA